MSMKKYKTHTAGFTLIETLVAVAIVALSVAGPLYSASRSLVAAQAAEGKLIATYLAQEGVEYVREMRDDGYLAAYSVPGATNVSDTAWNEFINSPGPVSIAQCRDSTCTLDPVQPMGTGSGFSLQPCSGVSCTPLYRRNDGVYTQLQAGNTRTSYTRTIQVFTVPVAAANPTEVRVVSRVSWDFHGTTQTVSVTDHLTPWQ